MRQPTPQSLLIDTTKGDGDNAYEDKIRRFQSDPYSASYKTQLRGDYLVDFGYNKYDEYLILRKGSKVIDTIGSCSLGLPYQNLGYVVADFEKTFVFMQTFGSGNPHIIQLYEKETGKNLLPDGSAWIGVDTLREFLLYSRIDIPSEKDSMTFLDTRENRASNFSFPSEIFTESGVLSRIKLRSASKSGFTIEYNVGGKIRVRKYGH